MENDNNNIDIIAVVMYNTYIYVLCIGKTRFAHAEPEMTKGAGFELRCVYRQDGYPVGTTDLLYFDVLYE